MPPCAHLRTGLDLLCLVIQPVMALIPESWLVRAAARHALAAILYPSDAGNFHRTRAEKLQPPW